MKRRVVVTGLGIISPIGNDIDTFWENVKKGTVGIGEITKFDTTDFKVKLAAEVKDFDATKYMDKREARRMELFSQYAVAAAKQAVEDSGLDLEKTDKNRMGVSIGSGVGSLQAMEREHKKLLEKGPGRISPMLVPMMYFVTMGYSRFADHFIKNQKLKQLCYYLVSIGTIVVALFLWARLLYPLYLQNYNGLH